MIRRLLALGVAAACAPVVLAAAPAQAETVTVTDATFTWGLSGYAQVGAQFGPWLFPTLSPEAALLAGSVSGGSQTEYAALPGETSMPASSPQKTPNAVKLVGGTGTADAATGAVDLSWTGSYVVNAYPKTYGAPDEIYADPELTVDAAGAGTLTFDVTIGAGQDMEGNPSPAQDLGRLTVLTFSAGSDTALGADGLRYEPDFAGTSVTESTPQNKGCTGWGSWPAAFVNALPDSVAPHFYTTGTGTGACAGLQTAKPALPVQVDLGLAGQVATTVALAAPGRSHGQNAGATVTVTGATDGPVAIVSGTTVLSRGQLSAGRATFSFGKPAAGSYPLQAVFYGTGTAAPSTSATTTLVIAKASSVTEITLTRRPTPRTGGAVTIDAFSPTVKPLTGRVTLRVKKGSKVVRTATPALRDGVARVALPKLPKGSYQLIASYAATRNIGSSSHEVTMTVR